MSLQIFLEGKLLGVDDCLLALASKDPDHVFTGRSHWISLLSEVLPRALLAELGLAKILLGSSGGGRFLVLLPEEARPDAEAFLEAASAEIGTLSNGSLKLIWSITENLGDWSDVRRRLHEEMDRRRGAPAVDASIFASAPPPSNTEADRFFANELGWNLRDAAAIG